MSKQSTHYATSRPVYDGNGERQIFSREELAQSPHPEVVEGVRAGATFTFGGVLYAPTDLFSRDTPARQPEALADWARNACPPRNVDMVAPAEGELRRSLDRTVPVVARRRRIDSGKLGLAVAVLVAIGISIAGYVVGSDVTRLAAPHYDRRVGQ